MRNFFSRIWNIFSGVMGDYAQLSRMKSMGVAALFK